MTPRLEIRGLFRRFGGRDGVHGVALSVYPGRVTCLLGPSGCGKSTTLRIAAGIDRQDAGEVAGDGETVSSDLRHDPPEARGIGLMFQDFALFPHLTVADNVGFGLRGSRLEKRARVDELLERVHLSKYAQKYPHELSGGEQQRVALVRAIAPKPRVMEEDMRMADEIALMRDGRVIQSGPPYGIYHAPNDKAAAAFFSDINAIQGAVKQGAVETHFGEFLATGFPDGAKVEIVIRPRHLRIDFDRNGTSPSPTPEDGTPVRGTVVRSRFVGNESLLEFRMDSDGSILKAAVPSVFLPKVETPFWLTLPRSRCFVFAA